MTRARLRWIVPTSLWLVVPIGIVVGFLVDWDGGLILIVLGVIAGGFFTLDAFGLTEDSLLAPRDPAEDQVKRLVEALSESTRVMAEIEREVKARAGLAQRLQADVQRHQELLELNREEVEAVAQTLRVEVRREGRRSVWIGLLVNALFFGLGVVVTLVLGG